MEAGLTQEATFNTGLGIGAAGGYDFGFVRVEGELCYRVSDLNKLTTGKYETVSAGGNISSWSFMVNGFYDFKNQTFFTPYIGAGLGLALVDMSTATAEDIRVGGGDDLVFDYQAEFGIASTLNTQVTLDFGYRYFSTSDPQMGNTDAEYKSNSLVFRVRYAF